MWYICTTKEYIATITNSYHEQKYMWSHGSIKGKRVSTKCIYILKLINLFQLEANYFMILWWSLPYIDTNQPWVYICPHPEPPSHLPPHPIPQDCPSNPGFEWPVSCIKLGLVIYFSYGNIHVSMLFSQIIPPLPYPTESKSLFFISVSLLLSRI